MQRRTVLFTGHVQGVGFRWTTVQVAQRFMVTGSVRNLPDGRVECIAEGEPREIDAFLEALREAMAGHINHEDAHQGPAQSNLPDFRIVR